jgi:hypothetical protein
MTTSISEVIRNWLGWCPNRMMASRSRTYKADYPVSSIPLGEGEHTIQDVIIDYGSTGMSIRLFTIILAGTIAGLFTVMRFGFMGIWSSGGILLLSIFILGVAVRMVYQDSKKASIELTPDAITIRRPFSTAVIAKDTITTIEIRKNVHHSRRWFILGATVIVVIGNLSYVLFREEFQYVSRIITRVSLPVFLMYSMSIIVFFGLMFYHGYIRSRNPRILAISTNNQKIVGLYVDDPEKMSEVISKWRAGGV